MDTNLPTDPSTGSPERRAQVSSQPKPLANHNQQASGPSHQPDLSSPDLSSPDLSSPNLSNPDRSLTAGNTSAENADAADQPWPPPPPRDQTLPRPRPVLSPWQQAIGPLCGLLSAILYTASNIGLRQCVDVNPYVVSAMKATPNLVLLTPWIVMHWAWKQQSSHTHSRPANPAKRATPSARHTRTRLIDFTVAAIFAQFLGNVAFQKALELIGISTVVPITLGTIIVCGAILGVVILKESIGLRKLIAMLTLITAVVVLAIPSQDSMDSQSPAEAKRQIAATDQASIAAEPSPSGLSNDSTVTESASVGSAASSKRAWQIIFGSGWAILSGLTYAYFGVAMRRSLRDGIGSTTLMLISGAVGVGLLWGYSLIQLGLIQISEIHARSWLWMSFAGLCNFIAFITLTASLKRLPLVAVNLINASQVALAATAGVILFSEPITVTLVVGLVLTLTGLMILARRTRASIVVTD